jgi:hypothetical protein
MMNLRDEIGVHYITKNFRFIFLSLKRSGHFSQFDSRDTVMVARTHRRNRSGSSKRHQTGGLCEKIPRFVVMVSLYLSGAVTQTLAATAFDEKAVADFYRGKTVRIIVGSLPAAVTTPIRA